LSDEQKAALEKTAAGFGIYKARPGEASDRKFGDKKASAGKQAQPRSPSAYAALVRLVGVRNLEFVEKAMFVTLAAVLAAFITGGLAISSLAFFKATASTPPEQLELFATNAVQSFFTPSLIFFFSLSTVYGLYKQAQMNAGATSYTEIGKPEDEK
jgi:hypothetical protein